MDTSSVFHREMLDDEHQRIFPAGLQFAFETADDISFFATEEEACTMQRDWRRHNGFDPITGERT